MVSPNKTPIGIATSPMFVPSLTPKRVTTILCALVTPVRFTVTCAPLTLELLTLPEEGHGLALRESREKVYGAVADFLDRYLKATIPKK